MKKVIPLIVLSFSLLTTLSGQFKQYVLAEHYTQASCGPCASQNPAFEEVRQANGSKIHHVAYHTSFPGYDPMYNFNPGHINEKTSYHSVGSVPTMILMGDKFRGSPVGVSNELVQSLGAVSAPVRLKVSLEKVEDEFSSTVSIYRSEDFEMEDLYLHAAVVEGLIEYNSPPGSNGEKKFPNVFRATLTDGKVGMRYTPSEDNSVVDEFTFTFDTDDAYQEDEIYVMAWLEHKPEKSVINSGSSKDPSWQYVTTPSESYKKTAGDHSFESKILADEDGRTYDISIKSDTNGEVESQLFINDAPIAPGEHVLNNGDIIKLENTTDGSDSRIDSYNITVKDIETEVFDVITFHAIQNITTLIVDHGSNSTRWSGDISTGLAQAETDILGSLNANGLVQAYNAGILDDVESIYDNVGWTFPGFVRGETAVLTDFLDKGGNLFIAGQDLGWDTWENSSNINADNRQFYTNYLGAKFINDGGSTNNILTPSDDVIYNRLSTSAIVNVNAGSNFYPDVVEPVDENSSEIFFYANSTRAGGIRTEKDDFKSVYLGVDLGMIADEAVRTDMIAITQDYFTGKISKTEFDRNIQHALGQNHPNPAVAYTTIEFDDLKKDAQLVIVDQRGVTVLREYIQAGSTSYDCDVTSLGAGTFIYYLETAEGRSSAKKLQVVR